MTPTFCPLFSQANQNPSALFIEGAQTFSYATFEQYVQQVAMNLKNIPPQSVIATQSGDTFFTIALLLAAVRSRLILFIINPRLPHKEVQKKLHESHCCLFFNSSILFDKSLKAPKYDAQPLDVEAPLTYLLTSGTKGHPKICVHSFNNHLKSAQASNQHLSYLPQDRWLLNMPLHHVSGLSLIFRTLCAKATLILPGKSLEEDLITKSISHFSCVNTQLDRALKKSPKLLKHLKVILLGGAKPLPHLIQKARALQLPLYLTYGLTEMSSQVAASLAPYKPLSLLPHVSVFIDSQNQILVKGPSLFLGYLIDQKIKRPMHQMDYFETNDSGDLTDNQLSVFARLDNLFIRGGENIHPEEIEDVLLKFPGIIEVIVIPIEHAEFDYQPVAFIKVEKTVDLSLIISFLKEHLPSYKIPTQFFPLQYENLKPSRQALKLSLSPKTAPIQPGSF